ncbi:MAG: hypothetical protein AB1714_00300, partial [Acidobacteriota bacterium]
ALHSRALRPTDHIEPRSPATRTEAGTKDTFDGVPVASITLAPSTRSCVGPGALSRRQCRPIRSSDNGAEMAVSEKPPVTAMPPHAAYHGEYHTSKAEINDNDIVIVFSLVVSSFPNMSGTCSARRLLR